MRRYKCRDMSQSSTIIHTKTTKSGIARINITEEISFPVIEKVRNRVQTCAFQVKWKFFKGLLNKKLGMQVFSLFSLFYNFLVHLYLGSVDSPFLSKVPFSVKKLDFLMTYLYMRGALDFATRK